MMRWILSGLSLLIWLAGAGWCAEPVTRQAGPQMGWIVVSPDGKSFIERSTDRGNPRLLDWQLFREHLADEWVRRQVEAIRRADPTRLATVGYIQWSYPLVRTGDPSLYAACNRIQAAIRE